MFHNPPLLCGIDFYLCQAQFELQNPLQCQTLRVYYLKTSSQLDYCLCHRQIYDKYLAKYSLLQTIKDTNFIFLNTHKDSVIFFLTCLYLHNKNKTCSIFRLSFANISNHSEILDLAHIYDLPWIQNLYQQVINKLKSPVKGPLYKMGNQIMCLNPASQIIFTIGAPKHMKAFITSTDGLSWYALCTPRPRLAQVWTKRQDRNEWSLITTLKDKRESWHFDLALTQGVCLYVLKDHQRLEYYDLLTHTWHRVTPALPPTTTYIMANTNHDVLPLLIVANSLDRRAYCCRRDQLTPLIDSSFCSTTSAPFSARRFHRSLCRQRHPREERVLTSIVAGIWAERQTDCPPPPLPVLPPPTISRAPLKSLPDLIKRIRATGRSFTHAAPPLKQQQEPVFNPNPCDPLKEWDKLFVVWPAAYGRQKNGSWWKNSLTQAHDNPRWSRFYPTHDRAEFTWDSSISKMHTTELIEEKTGFFVYINGESTRVNFFNPNYTDTSFVTVVDAETEGIEFPAVKGGLDGLANCRVSINSNYTLTLFPALGGELIPPALSHLISQLTLELSREIKNGTKDVVYDNGGIKRLTHLDPNTGNQLLELYVTHPPAHHVVFKTNMTAFIDRYAPVDSQPQFLGVGSMCHTNSDYTQFSYWPCRHFEDSPKGIIDAI
nr:ORF118 [Acipenserid herpesvirus 1]